MDTPGTQTPGPQTPGPQTPGIVITGVSGRMGRMLVREVLRRAPAGWSARSSGRATTGWGATSARRWAGRSWG